MSNILGFQPVTFNFGDTTTSTETSTSNFSPPQGTTEVQVVLTGFDLSYTDSEEYGFGALQVSVNSSGIQTATCEVTLRDNNTNKREWSGSVQGLVICYEG
jgi:hypothetical protein